MLTEIILTTHPIIGIMMMTGHITGFKVLMKVMRNSLKTWTIMRMKSADWN